MGARVYSGAATPTTITSSITNVSTSVTIASATNWLTSGQFSVVIDPGLSGEEKSLATLSGTTLTFVTRGYDNTTAASHNSGASIYPVPTAIDFSEANTHVNASSAVHGVAGTIVGTTDTQTLTNKDLTSGTNTFPATLVTTTGTQTLTNKTLTSPVINGGVVTSLLEGANTVASAATGTINFDVITSSVWYYTTSASANFTLNFRGNSGTTLNTLLANNQSVTCVFLNTNGATPYYASAITIDGTSVTPKWQGGTAPTAGNASAIDAYSYTIYKTASATYTIFASQTKFA